jgi:hypothetical protein
LAATLTMVTPHYWVASAFAQELGSGLSFGDKTVLVYQNQTGEETHQFVVRIARFRPDIFLEWESYSHQGTIHLRKKAVAEAKKITIGGLFEAGVDMDSKDVMTNWLSARMYRQLLQDGEVKVQLNRHKLRMNLVSEETRQVTVDGVVSNVAVFRIEDNNNGTWIVHKNLENPVLIEYQSPHYHMRLARISTSKSNNLRWIRQLPPVK